MFSDIEITELLAKRERRQVTTIDVRSPAEFEEATIPGSLNIPLFDNEERAEIGTLYTQVSVEAAKQRGLEIVSAKLPQFIGKFQSIQGDKVVFCWRGGMRSRTAATLLSLMDVYVQRLNGGIRAYRRWVVDELSRLELKPKPYIINGNTGSGKTAILRRLAAEQYPVLDLEGMAGHRGSVFGAVGLKPHNQKMFDSLLLHQVLNIQEASFVLFEAESNRIGKVTLPEFLVQAKEQATQIWIELPMEERVKQIMADYEPETNEQQCFAAFQRIKERIHIPVAKEIEAYLMARRFAEAVELLLVHYYDPRYQNSIYDAPIRVMLQAKDSDDAAGQIKQLLEDKR